MGIIPCRLTKQLLWNGHKQGSGCTHLCHLAAEIRNSQSALSLRIPDDQSLADYVAGASVLPTV
jgi:hypothetical protein